MISSMQYVVAISVGVLSGVLGTFATINHQRLAERRSRMLDAADEFLRSASKALSVVDITERVTRRGSPRELAVAVDAVLETIPRLLLLFPDESEAVGHARSTHGELDIISGYATGVAREGAQWPAADVKQRKHNARRAMEAFTRSASAEVNATRTRVFGVPVA